MYAELHCHSNFSFLDGASHPEELAEEAARLGLVALGTGVTLLRPRTRWSQVAIGAAFVLAVVVGLGIRT